MSDTLTYKGYKGSIEFSEADKLLYGQVLGVRALISYDGSTVSELIDSFHEAVDDYLEVCRAQGIKPEAAKLESGNFNPSAEYYKPPRQKVWESLPGIMSYFSDKIPMHKVKETYPYLSHAAYRFSWGQGCNL